MDINNIIYEDFFHYLISVNFSITSYIYFIEKYRLTANYTQIVKCIIRTLQNSIYNMYDGFYQNYKDDKRIKINDWVIFYSNTDSTLRYGIVIYIKDHNYDVKEIFVQELDKDIPTEINNMYYKYNYIGTEDIYNLIEYKYKLKKILLEYYVE